MVRPLPAISSGLVAFASRLRFPVLFILFAVLFLVDLVMLDAIPFADELLLGLGATLFGTWKKRRREQSGESDTNGEREEVGAD